MENEIWKQVKNIVLRNGTVWTFEGYEVSNYGRVRTYKQKYGRVSNSGINAGLNRPLLKTPTIINGRADKRGYPQFLLSDINKKRHNVRAHTLVMQTFVGLPDEYQVVCHFDDVKTNNHLDNLRYDTQKQNLLDAKRNNIKLGKK
jgi:hypothetical protein